MSRRLLKLRRFLLAATLVAVAALVFAAGAYATGSNISPEEQTVDSGNQASWHASWSGASPFNVYFYFGDGNEATPLHTSATSHTYPHTFYTCYDETYTQTLEVEDADSLWGVAQAETHVLAGEIC